MRASTDSGIAQLGTEQPSMPMTSMPSGKPDMSCITLCMRACTGWSGSQ